MDPQSIKKYLIPAVALAAVIVIVGLLLGLGGDPSGSGTKTTAPNGGTPDKPKGPLVPAGADTSDAGMSDSAPSTTEGKWLVLPGGLKIHDVKDGTGESVSAGQTVSAHYSGWLTDGSPFDSSRSRGAPTEFRLDQVVAGWSNGIPGMKVGGIRRLFIPYKMGYGDAGAGSIPPKADLIFEVKLIAFQ